MKKIKFNLTEFWLALSNQVPIYIEHGQRQEWLKKQEEDFIPSFIQDSERELWNQTLDKCAAEGNLLKLVLAKENWKRLSDSKQL